MGRALRWQSCNASATDSSPQCIQRVLLESVARISEGKSRDHCEDSPGRLQHGWGFASLTPLQYQKGAASTGSQAAAHGGGAIRSRTLPALSTGTPKRLLPSVRRSRYYSGMSRLPLTIRSARIEDAQVLAQAERTIAENPGLLVSLPSELTDERFEQKIIALGGADNGRFLVAETGEQIVGHGMLDPLPLSAVRHVVHLTLVAHDGCQGMGVGRALLGALIDWARAASAVEKIELNVRSSNTPAQALYRKMGFTEMGRWRRRVKVAPGEYLDDVAMELFVESPASVS